MARRPGLLRKRAASPSRNRRRAKRTVATSSARFPVVAIGASAGGLRSLRKFFGAVAEDTAIAFVVAQHLDPSQTSLLAELIQRDCRLPVRETAATLVLEPRHVYVLAPGRIAALKGDALVLGQVAKLEAHESIDTLFRSVAEQRGPRGACVVLSGTGSSGSLGLKAVKAADGIALVESPESAEYDGMPRAAIATGLADYVAPAENLAGIAIGYFARVPGSADTDTLGADRQSIERRLPEVFALIRTRTTHDFRDYKTSTLIRRVQRRMGIGHITDLDSYLAELRKSPEEVNHLFHDLLISVTQFFRDAPAYSALRQKVLAKLVANRSPDDPIRVWVPGAATGEEGYTVAMLLHELASKLDAPPKLQVFVTDIDPDALEIGRAAIYPRSIEASVGDKQLRRHFVRENSGYRVRKEIRDICVFSTHNMISDPPFSKLDLISCRNVLIYFNNELQRRVMPVLHYALKSGGYLFLGPSENVAETRLFAAIDKKYRIFRRLDVPVENFAELPLAAYRPRAPRINGRISSAPTLDFSRLTERVFLDNFAMPFVVVNEHFDILQVTGRTGRYLELPDGAVRPSILDLARLDIRPELRTALQRAVESKADVVRENILADSDGSEQRIDLIVHPLNELPSADRCYMVVFRDRAASVTGSAKGRSGKRGESGPLLEIEDELAATKRQLQTSIEEQSASIEELRSANEELLSMNEELQSANEELDTSKEELQSINEELQTVNAELNGKIQQLAESRDDVRNLLQSTQIATIFLDTGLRIRYFTPKVVEIFNLLETDIGRPLRHFTGKLDPKALERDAKSVLHSLAPIEREVPLTDGDRTYLMRVLPYRSVGDAIGGVAITLLDITERKRTEAQRTRHVALVEASHDAIIRLSIDGKVIAWNRGAEKLFGYKANAAIGQPMSDFIMSASEVRNLLDEVKRRGTVSDREVTGRPQRGQPVPISLTVSAAIADLGDTAAISIVARDITERKAFETRQAILMQELNHRVKNSLATAQSLLRLTYRKGASAEDVVTTFGDRLRALAQTHDLLSKSDWRGASLKSIIETELAPYFSKRRGASNISISGPNAVVPPKAAVSLALVFHELATNAAKHGALSIPGGKVAIDWRNKRTDGVNQLLIDWTEGGGPKVERPETSGLGRTLIEDALVHDLRAESKLEFRPSGVHWAGKLALDSETMLETSGDDSKRAVEPRGVPNPPRRGRVHPRQRHGAVPPGARV